ESTFQGARRELVAKGLVIEPDDDQTGLYTRTANGQNGLRLADLRRMGRLAMWTTPPLVPPCPYISLFDVSDNIREGFVEPSDFKVLLSHLPPDMADGTEFAYNSAWRREMIFQHTIWPYVTLEWDRDHRTITGGTIKLPARVVKNKLPITIVLKGRLLDIIRRRWTKRVPSCPLVFHRDGKRITDFRTCWTKACEAAGLP